MLALLHRAASGASSLTSRRMRVQIVFVATLDTGAVTGFSGGQVASPGGTWVSMTMFARSTSRCSARRGAASPAARDVTATTVAPAWAADSATSTGNGLVPELENTMTVSCAP